MADAKALLESIARSFGYIYGRERKIRINTISQSPTMTTAGSGERVMGGLPPVIYGSGLQTRDYTYVDDIVEAYDLILKYPNPLREPINFGTGADVSIIDLAQKIIDLCGKDLTPVHVEERPGEVQRLVADISKARKLGWEPKYSIDEGLKKFIKWYRNYKVEEWAKPR